ncbi:amidase [Gordonia hydrophobica]|uniref:amidase n=1 Tax=Gordonia hydrophobica TaxID=40516 RepID=A0ABZ2U6T6_9ACTN|nr:amidase [Gordonia hydrophobica]MBM7365437.1 aspartyl-tRNA(Asn)/glutamyl-tRNA(Gln) amidotransferase subunit A [Gordonia hydrophobica]
MAPTRTDVCAFSALELSKAYLDGSLSPVEVATEVLDAVGRVDGELNAFCLVDREGALASARAAEERYRAGSPRGPLDGVPVSIKDIFLTAGHPTRRGSRLVADRDDGTVPTVDAPVVAAALAAGCVPFGKTTTPELAWKGVTDSLLTGITRNPHDPATTPGGSSGGSAAAVAAGLGPLSIGTDGGGSVRIPASFTGTVALKPTYGVVPMYPSSPFGTLAHAGPMTRSVTDAAAFMDVLIRPDARDWSAMPPSATSPDVDGYLVAALDGTLGARPLEGLRVAYSPTLGFATNQPDVERTVDAAVATMAELGATVESVDPGLSDPVDAFHILWFAGAAAVLKPFGDDAVDHVDPRLREALARYHDYTAQDYLDAVAERMALGRRLGALHDDYDVLVTPTMPITAFAAGADVPPGWHSPDWTSWTPYTYVFNMTQQPALSIPCGVADNGLPVGLQIVGARFADRLVMRTGAALHERIADRTPRPRVHACQGA